MGRSHKRVGANSDGAGLAHAERRQLTHGFISQRSRTRDNPDASFAVNMPWHDSDLALAGRDNSGTIRADQARGFLAEIFFDLNHVERRNSFGDADDHRNARFG